MSWIQKKQEANRQQSVRKRNDADAEKRRLLIQQAKALVVATGEKPKFGTKGVTQRVNNPQFAKGATTLLVPFTILSMEVDSLVQIVNRHSNLEAVKQCDMRKVGTELAPMTEIKIAGSINFINEMTEHAASLMDDQE